MFIGHMSVFCEMLFVSFAYFSVVLFILYFYLVCISSLYILDNNYLLQVSLLKTKISLF